MSTADPGPSAGPPAQGEPERPRRRRDRHGRGPRGPLLPLEVVPPGTRRPVRVPRALTRSEQFDDLVAGVLQVLESRVTPEELPRLTALEVAVEDVPLVPDAGTVVSADLLEEGGVPLALLHEAEPDRRDARPPRVVLYRRPLEARAGDAQEQLEVVLDVLVEAVARLLQIDPDRLHPDGPDEEG